MERITIQEIELQSHTCFTQNSEVNLSITTTEVNLSMVVHHWYAFLRQRFTEPTSFEGFTKNILFSLTRLLKILFPNSMFNLETTLLYFTLFEDPCKL